MSSQAGAAAAAGKPVTVVGAGTPSSAAVVSSAVTPQQQIQACVEVTCFVETVWKKHGEIKHATFVNV